VTKSPKRTALILAIEQSIKPPPGKLMTVGELADFLQLHPSMQLHPATIYRRLRQGRLPAVRVGSRWCFSRETIGRWCPVQLETKSSMRLVD
jgi:excisionase family DNA binding protein